jgi:hypothetical protein
MRINKRVMIILLTAFIFGFNLSTIATSASETIQSTHYWRVCQRAWTKNDFNLPSHAPNVYVTATWAYNYDTGVTSHVWSVTNATKVNFSVYGISALPRVYIDHWENIDPGYYMQGTCYYQYAPIGTEPFSTPLETE